MITSRQWLATAVVAVLLHTLAVLWLVPQGNKASPLAGSAGGGLEVGIGDAGGGDMQVQAGDLAEAELAEAAAVTAQKLPPSAPVAKVVPQTVASAEAQPEPIPEAVKPVAEPALAIETYRQPVSTNLMAVATAEEKPLAAAVTAQPAKNTESLAVPDTSNAISLAHSVNSAVHPAAGEGGKRYGNSGKGPGSGKGKGKSRGNGKLLRGYFSDISALIDAHKDYPDEVKKKKHEGIVIVDFTISRSGELLSSAIRKSSGHPLLDQAALATLARSSPFPPIPDLLDRETLKIAVPIDYTLIQNQ